MKLFREYRINQCRRRIASLKAQHAEFDRFISKTFETGGEVGGLSVTVLSQLKGQIASEQMRLAILQGFASNHDARLRQ